MSENDKPKPYVVPGLPGADTHPNRAERRRLESEQRKREPRTKKVSVQRFVEAMPPAHVIPTSVMKGVQWRAYDTGVVNPLVVVEGEPQELAVVASQAIDNVNPTTRMDGYINALISSIHRGARFHASRLETMALLDLARLLRQARNGNYPTEVWPKAVRQQSPGSHMRKEAEVALVYLAELIFTHERIEGNEETRKRRASSRAASAVDAALKERYRVGDRPDDKPFTLAQWFGPAGGPEPRVYTSEDENLHPAHVTILSWWTKSRYDAKVMSGVKRQHDPSLPAELLIASVTIHAVERIVHSAKAIAPENLALMRDSQCETAVEK